MKEELIKALKEALEKMSGEKEDGECECSDCSKCCDCCPCKNKMMEKEDDVD
jgi:hypothetical protein